MSFPFQSGILSPLLPRRPTRPTVPPPWAYDAATLERVEQAVVSTSVARRDRRDQPLLCRIRFLDRHDLDDMEALNRLVLSRLAHPHILRNEDRAWLERHIRARGRCIGTFHGETMVAFTVLSFPRDDPDNLGLDLGLDREQRLHSCHFELTAVHPDYRGNHLHRAMNELRAQFAGAAGYHHLFGTVSPMNPYSLNNHFAAGFMIRKLVKKYGGMDRFIISRDFHLDRGLSGEALAGAEMRLSLDLCGQRELLEQGYCGVAVSRSDDDWVVTYVPANKVTFSERTEQPGHGDVAQGEVARTAP